MTLIYLDVDEKVENVGRRMLNLGALHRLLQEVLIEDGQGFFSRAWHLCRAVGRSENPWGNLDIGEVDDPRPVLKVWGQNSNPWRDNSWHLSARNSPRISTI